MNAKPEFTIVDFQRELNQFRMLLGSKTFWELPEQTHKAAIHGLAFVYVNTKATDDIPDDMLHAWYWTHMDQYQRRAEYIARNPRPPLTPKDFPIYSMKKP